jgi:SNF2 family DNA or RNA helicase
LRGYDDVVNNYLVVGWSMLQLMPILAQVPWDWIIADEAHAIKNPSTKTHRAFNKLEAERKILVTATPGSNNPGELWALLHAVQPKFYPNYQMFRDIYVEEIHVGRGRKVVDVRYKELLERELVVPMIRRLKSEVEVELPEKTFQRIPLNLTEDQVRLYKQMAVELAMEIDGGVILKAPNAAAKIVRLREIVSGLATLPGGRDISAKLDVAVDIIMDRQPRSTVVFSVFRQTVFALAARLQAQGIECSILVGGMKPDLIELAKQDFQSGKTQVFIATIRAGGVGLTLTAADMLLFIERDWNPAMQDQAVDRIHRLGQKNACLIADLYVAHTVDALVDMNLENKLSMQEGIITREIRKSVADSLKYL